MQTFLLSLGPTEFPDLEQLRFSDPLVETGRLNYLGKGRCQDCHQNGGGDFTLEGFGDKLVDIGSQFSETPADLPDDAGFGLVPHPEGGFGDGRFVTPAVLFAADTPPFFHNGLAATLFWLAWAALWRRC